MNGEECPAAVLVYCVDCLCYRGQSKWCGACSEEQKQACYTKAVAEHSSAVVVQKEQGDEQVD